MASGTKRKETKKLCGHSLTGACNFGNSCRDFHPIDKAAATTEQKVKKTLSLCDFFPKCTVGGVNGEGCTYLHVAVVAKGAAPAIEPTIRMHRAPTGKTPARPPRTERKAPTPSARRADRRADLDEAPAFTTLRRIRAKINAIRNVESASQIIASALSGPAAAEATARAGRAASMQGEIEKALDDLAGQLDAYVASLGAKVEPADDEDAQGEEVGTSSQGSVEASAPIQTNGGPIRSAEAIVAARLDERSRSDK